MEGFDAGALDGAEAAFVEPGEALAELGEEGSRAEADQAGDGLAAADFDAAAGGDGIGALAVDGEHAGVLLSEAEVDHGVGGEHERGGGGEVGRDGGEHNAAGAGVQDGAAGGERVAGAAGGAGDDDRVGADDADGVGVDVDGEVGGLAEAAAAEHHVVEGGHCGGGVGCAAGARFEH